VDLVFLWVVASLTWMQETLLGRSTLSRLMWEHRNVEDAITRYGVMESHTWRVCHA
jgi:hypothetical protein